MKRFALLSMLLGLGFIAGCEKPKAAPAPPAAPPAETPAAEEPAGTEKPAAEKPADDMPEEEGAKDK